MLGVWGKVIEMVEDGGERQVFNVFIRQRNETMKVMHYIEGNDRCQVGDWVQVNTSAVDLGLGTGGYGFVTGRLSPTSHSTAPSNHHGSDEGEDASEGFSAPKGYLMKRKGHLMERKGHLMKMRYSPQQTPVLAVEAPESRQHAFFRTPFSLEGKKVLVGELHSMLPVAASLLHKWQRPSKLVYIMDDQACLHLAFSDHVRRLKQKMNVRTITYGQALGGDLETINIYTALEAAVKVEEADHILITQGPGVTGTATKRGFSGMQLAHWVHAVHTCGGETVVIPRIQFADRRERHQGLSHHTLEPLAEHTLVRAHVPYPLHLEQTTDRDERLSRDMDVLRTRHDLHAVDIAAVKNDLEEALADYGVRIQTMGRTYEDEPYFFYAVAAAVYYYLQQT